MVDSENGRGLNITPPNTYLAKINKSMVYFLAASTNCFAYSRTSCKQNLSKTWTSATDPAKCESTT